MLYLNEGGGQDFSGGDFVFRDPIEGSDLRRVVSRPGGLLMFTSGPENVHRVEEVKSGTRFALNIFFTMNPSASEDPRYLAMVPDDLREPFLLPDGSSKDENSVSGPNMAAQDKGVNEGGMGSRPQQPGVNPNETVILRKVAETRLECAEGFGLDSEPLIVRLGGVEVPALFGGLPDALDFAYYTVWQGGRGGDVMALFTRWHEHRSRRLLSVMQAIPKWRELGEFRSVSLKRSREE